MKERLGVKVKFLHVIRNPFDNIATFVLRHRAVNARKRDHKIKVRNFQERIAVDVFKVDCSKSVNGWM